MTQFLSKLGSLQWPDGQSNPSGIPTECYFIEKSAIVSFPQLDPDASALEQGGVMQGEYVLKDGAFFHRLYSTQGTGSLSFEFVGEKDCKAVNNKGSFSFPDLSVAANALVSKLANTNVIIVAPRYVSGGKVVYSVLGNKDFDSEISPSGTTGSKPGDKKGVTFEVVAPDFAALPAYQGTLPLEDGTLDCLTGVFTPKDSAVSQE